MTENENPRLRGNSLSDELAALADRLDDLTFTATSIAQQMTEHGKSDREWYARAKSALKINNRERQKLQEEMAEVRRKQRMRRGNSFEVLFREAVKETAGEAIFQIAWDLAHKRLNAE